MAPFRWPSTQNDLAVAQEVASRKPQTRQDWDEIAAVLSEVFSSDSSRVDLKGRGCRERLARLIDFVQISSNSSVLRPANLKSRIWVDG